MAYVDFECLTKPLHNCKPNPENSFTIEYQKHEPYGFLPVIFHNFKDMMLIFSLKNYQRSMVIYHVFQQQKKDIFIF